jgi:hypothetical protein
MRLLLLLSALLSSLCGVVSGAASATTQVEASVSVADARREVRSVPATRSPTVRLAERRAWHVARVAPAARRLPLYADRLRE